MAPTGPLRALSDFRDPAANPEERRRRRDEAHLALQSKLSMLRQLHLVSAERKAELPSAGSMLGPDGAPSPAMYAHRLEQSLARLAKRSAEMQKKLVAERDAARATSNALGAALGAALTRLANVDPDRARLEADKSAAEAKAERLARHVRELQDKVRELAGGGHVDVRSGVTGVHGQHGHHDYEENMARVAHMAGQRRTAPDEFAFSEALREEAPPSPAVLAAQAQQAEVERQALDTAAGLEDIEEVLVAAEEKAAADLRLRVAEVRAGQRSLDHTTHGHRRASGTHLTPEPATPVSVATVATPKSPIELARERAEAAKAGQSTSPSPPRHQSAAAAPRPQSATAATGPRHQSVTVAPRRPNLAEQARKRASITMPGPTAR